jgi:hypothetical protein
MKRYSVTRWCCTSAQCVDCRRAGKRTRVVQMDTDDEPIAKACLKGWRQYDAVLIDNFRKD